MPGRIEWEPPAQVSDLSGEVELQPQQGGSLAHDVVYPATGSVCDLTEKVALRAMVKQDENTAEGISANLISDAEHAAMLAHDPWDAINTLAAGLIKFRPPEKSDAVEDEPEVEEEEEADEGKSGSESQTQAKG